MSKVTAKKETRTVIEGVEVIYPDEQYVDENTGEFLDGYPGYEGYDISWRYSTALEAMEAGFLNDPAEWAVVVAPRGKSGKPTVFYGEEMYEGYEGMDKATPDFLLSLWDGANTMKVGEERKKGVRRLKRLSKDLFYYKHSCGDEVAFKADVLRDLVKEIKKAVK